MRLLVAIVIAFMLANTVHAASFKLNTKESEPLYQTLLTKEVYQYSSLNQLRDIAITNADGESVPYALMPYKNAYAQTTVTEISAPLVIFPMQEDSLKQNNVTSIQLNKRDNGTSVNVTSNDPKTISKTYYLFDLGKEHPAFKKLTLDWQGQEGKLLNLDVMASNDLNNWTYVGEATLLKVSASNHMVIQNSVTFDHSINARYLQIRPQETTDAFTLTSVNLAFNEVQDVAQPIIMQEISFSQRDEQSNKTHIDFESSGRYPATHLKIKLPQENTITNVTILTRNELDKPWQQLSYASLYKLNKQGKDFVNEDIGIPTTTARYWRLTFDQASGGIGKMNPQLSLGWLPDLLVWNARGTGPFVLSLGEPKDKLNTVPITNLMNPYGIKKIQEIPQSTLTLISHEQTFNAWKPSSNTKQLWLWGGLLLGVLALARMAYSLVKNNPTT